jgi:hypothetical protein
MPITNHVYEPRDGESVYTLTEGGEEFSLAVEPHNRNRNLLTLWQGERYDENNFLVAQSDPLRLAYSEDREEFYAIVANVFGEKPWIREALTLIARVHPERVKEALAKLTKATTDDPDYVTLRGHEPPIYRTPDGYRLDASGQGTLIPPSNFTGRIAEDVVVDDGSGEIDRFFTVEARMSGRLARFEAVTLSYARQLANEKTSAPDLSDRESQGQKGTYRGVSYVPPIRAAKEAVQVTELAGRLTGLKRTGRGWIGRCPLPNHEDSTPSFNVYPETNSWYCFACLRGGDVVDLARLAWSYDERDAHMAAANLLHEFGHQIPPRPPAWFRKQERQKPLRDAAHQAKVKSVQRRLMHIFAPLAAGIEDPAEYDEEVETLWDGCGRMARLMVDRAPIHARNMERAS